MEESTENLDVEFKRYLQIMRPYLGQLVDEDAIYICNAWVKRLSNCSESEKPMRNRYIFQLCYQLAKGVLDVPFLNCPSEEELAPISEVMDSDSTSGSTEYTTEADDEKTRVIYTKPILTETDCLSQDIDFEKAYSSRFSDTKTPATTDGKVSQATRKMTIQCYTCPEMMRACAAEVQALSGEREYRANNLIMRLREIKKQNMLLHNELHALKQESRGRTVKSDSLLKVNQSTSAIQNKSDTQRSIITKLHEVEEDKQNLLDTITSLQEQIDNFHEVKRVELEDLKAKHKLEIVKLKASLRDESKDMYDDKLDELKSYYEDLINDMKQNNEIGINDIKKRCNETAQEKDKMIQETVKSLDEKTKEIEEKNIKIQLLDKKVVELNTILHEREKTIEEKNRLIEDKVKEAATLKGQLDDQQNNLQTIIGKFLEKPSADVTAESMKYKTHELEKRLNKAEKAKVKYAKMYENKLASIQREKHLTECSLQLQLVRQRAQVVNEIAEENQSELTEALDKLEAKYKDIVANVQSAAIQRRMQDQIALDAVLQSVCGFRNELTTDQSQFSGKTVTVRPKDENSYECDISGIIRNKMSTNKSYGEDSVPAGYCLDGERFGELFEKMHIPQRDISDIPLKK